MIDVPQMSKSPMYVNGQMTLEWQEFFRRLAGGQVSNFLLEVSKGNVPGHSVYRKFGKIDAVH